MFALTITSLRDVDEEAFWDSDAELTFSLIGGVFPEVLSQGVNSILTSVKVLIEVYGPAPTIRRAVSRAKDTNLMRSDDRY